MIGWQASKSFDPCIKKKKTFDITKKAYLSVFSHGMIKFFHVKVASNWERSLVRNVFWRCLCCLICSRTTLPRSRGTLLWSAENRSWLSYRICPTVTPSAPPAAGVSSQRRVQPGCPLPAASPAQCPGPSPAARCPARPTPEPIRAEKRSRTEPNCLSQL